MNERIRQLYYECCDESLTTEQSYQKFAELIVRECMSIIKQGDGLGNEDDFDKGFEAGIAMAYNRVRAQMGVEE